ncbi:MAG: RnfABCDGE type electron transport complex subunit G [Lachnospirales bacterium]
MNNILKCAIVLLGISGVSSFALANVKTITDPYIAEQEALATERALNAVMPTAPSYQLIEGEDFTGTTITNLYEGEGVGYVVEVNPKGYGGSIKMLVGFDYDGVITGVDIVTHSETPGLGANADKPEFTDQFIGKVPTIEIVKSGATGDNQVDAITSSTITSNAVATGVNEAFAFIHAEDDEHSIDDALNRTMPDATTFTAVDDVDFSNTNVTNLYEGEGVGYVVEVNPKGYAAPIQMLVGFDNDDVITGIDIVSHEETPGLGSHITTEEFKDQFIGKSANLTVVKSEPSAENEVKAIASATVSTNAVVDGVKEAYDFVSNIKEGK